MELEFKPDFFKAKENWRRMWDGTLDRPILLITFPKPNCETVDKPAWGAAINSSFDMICDQVLRWAETHIFYADSIPFHTPSLIIGLYEALAGAEIEIIQESWGTDTRVVPFLEDLDSFEGRLRRESQWWEKWVSLLETMKCKLGGRIIFGEGFPGGNLDQLSALRGTTKFMYDFYDNPTGVHHVMSEMQNIFDEFHEENKSLMEYEKYGSITRHGFYSDKITGVPQSDAAFSISKEHFDEFGLPYLKREIARLNDIEYHLDGKGNLTHLDSICGIQDIGVIQWVPGTGTAETDWTPLFRDITSRGKGLWLGVRSPEQAVNLWRDYGSSGRLILSCHAETEKEAEQYLNKFDW